MNEQQRVRSFFAGSVVLKVTFAAIIIAAVLHVIWWSIAGPWDPGKYSLFLDIASRFGMDNELSVPTWLVSALALLTAACMFIIARHSKIGRATWYTLAAIFLLLAIDETVALHELLLQGVHVLAGLGEGQTFTSNAWLILAPLIALLGVLLLVILWRSLPRKTFWRFFVAFAVYGSGAFVIEYLGIQTDKAALHYQLLFVTVEETLELLGVWLALRAAIMHIKAHQPKLDAQLVSLLRPEPKH